MFDFVAKHKRLIQIVLGLMIIPPFAFWGIQWTQRGMGSTGDVAEVGGQKITEEEFTEALRRQQDQLRGRIDPSFLDSPLIRREVLEGMISQRLLLQHAARGYLTVPDEMLIETIMSIPAFQVDGKFSKERYDIALQNERLTAEQFDALLRRDLIVQQLTGALAESGFVSKAAAEHFAALRAQQREVAEHRIRADAKAVQIAPDAIRAFYDANPARFQVPEEVQVEYLVLSADALG